MKKQEILELINTTYNLDITSDMFTVNELNTFIHFHKRKYTIKSIHACTEEELKNTDNIRFNYGYMAIKVKESPIKHTWQEEFALMQEVEKILKKWEKKLSKVKKGKEYHGEGMPSRVPYCVTTNNISLNYNDWNYGGYYGCDRFMCIYLKVGTANLKNIEAHFKVNSVFSGVFEKITGEIDKAIKKHGGYQNENGKWVFIGENDSRLYSLQEYGSSWCPIALINNKHKYP